MRTKYKNFDLIDNNHYYISRRKAIELFGSLPRIGYDKRVTWRGQAHCWLKRTRVNGVNVFCIFKPVQLDIGYYHLHIDQTL